MTLADSFASPKRRIARAKRHITDLNRRIGKFFIKCPYTKVVERDTDGSTDLHKIRLLKPLPESMGDLASSIIEDLRSALDQAAFATAHAAGRTAAKSAYFPISDNAFELENVIKGRCKDIPQDIVTLFRSFNPYKGGNDLVWTVNRLCNASKHKLLIPIGVASGGIGIKHMTLAAAPFGIGLAIPALSWDGEKNEMVFARVGIGSQLDYDLNFSFFVAFGEVESVRDQPAIPVLNAAASEVERIILAIETESRRIGLIA